MSSNRRSRRILATAFVAAASLASHVCHSAPGSSGAKRGHRVEVVNDPGYGGYQAIRNDDGVWVGASESRKDGHAAGY
jgi:gamma-glutamyltranspeptidase